MAITDELRGWWVRTFPVMDKELHEEFTAIAHNIDAEHERATSEFWQKINAVPVTDESMTEHGWVRLPVDADGVTIHVGERVQLIGNDPSTVSHMSLADDGWRVYVKYDGGIGTGSGEPKRIRHHKQPTVEDVLRDFAEQYAFFKEVGTGIHPDLKSHEEVLRQFAAKLRLAGDGDE